MSKGGLSISHILFAYDSVIFSKASNDECGGVSDILAKYEVKKFYINICSYLFCVFAVGLTLCRIT